MFASTISPSVAMTTGVGTILLFLLSLPSSVPGTDCKSRFFVPDPASSRSDSLSLITLFALVVPLCLWAGVNGGVLMGTGPEFAAARLGTDDMAGVGAFMALWSPAPVANDEAVAMLETELLLVGLPGLAGIKELKDAG